MKINKIRGFSLSPQETEYSVSCGEEIPPLYSKSISEIPYLSYITQNS